MSFETDVQVRGLGRTVSRNGLSISLIKSQAEPLQDKVSASPRVTRVPDFAGASEPGLATRIYRFVSIAWLAVRIYLPYKAIQLWSRITGGKGKKEGRYRRQDLRAARALYHTSIRLEGLLIKAGQFIATRADILPDEWVTTLAGLQDRVPPKRFEIIKGQVERELGRPLAQMFASFEETPIAAASLAQVHRAVAPDGRRCAVKVQYPGIDGIVRCDLRNLMLTLKVLAWLEPHFDFQVIAGEILKYIPMELDFVNEARNCEIVRENFAKQPDVVIPRVYHELTSRRVLTMELVEGIRVTDIEGMARAGIDKRWVGQKLIEIFTEQILRDGFFHADPHPGNILVQPGPRIVLLDFGLAKDFPPAFREAMVRLTFAILSSNREGILSAFHDLGFRTRDDSPETLLMLADLFLGNSVKRNRAFADSELIEEFAEDLPKTLRANPIVEVPADVLLVNRVMGLLSGIGKTLDSQVNMFATLMPYAQTLAAAQGEGP
ncbi:MAG TPA: AarF/UbiB family protein [Candidatus Binataceae bacterium]|nr:AarF/UbiB family protein [Candidatus Binataceae bacterium]